MILTKSKFRVVVKTHESNLLEGQFLKGPRTPAEVKKLGYAFTKEESEAWTFPTEAQAAQKARVVARHIGWKDTATQAEVAP